MSIEIIDVTPEQVELREVVAGPRGPAGPDGVVTADQLDGIADQVAADLDDMPDLALLYANAKA